MSKLIKFIIKIFTIIGIIVTISSFIDLIVKINNREYRKEKEITIYYYDSEKIIKNSISNKIKLYYENNLVQNIYYKSFLIKNTGKKEINPIDYIENLCIEISESNILDAQLISYSNTYIQKNIIENTIIENNKICFSNVLLNSDDYYQINVITDELPKNIKVSGTISGISKLNINNSKTVQYKITVAKKVSTIIIITVIIFVLAVIIQFLIYFIIQKLRIKRFMTTFKCDEQIAKIFSTYYFEKIKNIRKNGKNVDKDIKSINKELKKYINDITKPKNT